LYISAIVEGYELVDVPPNDALRAELEGLPLPQLVERLEKSDAEAAGRIDKSNRRRLIRASKLPLPATRMPPPAAAPALRLPATGADLATRSPRKKNRATSPGPPGPGHDRRGGGSPLPGVSDTRLDKLGLEYRFITRYLRGELGTLEDLCRELGIAIRQFAKGQITWFKRDRRIIWLDPFRDYFEEACDRIREWEAKPPCLEPRGSS